MRFLVCSGMAGIGFVLLAGALWAQGTADDYRRSETFGAWTGDKVARERIEVRWWEGGESGWYRVDLTQGRREYVRFHAVESVREAMFDHAALATALAAALGQELAGDRLELDQFENQGADVSFAGYGKRWLWRREQGTLEEITAPEVAAEQRDENEGRRGRRRRGWRAGENPEGKSPEGRYEAFVRDHNLWLRDTQDGTESAWTTDGSEADGYDGRIWWSPDGRHAVSLRVRRAPTRKVHLIESSPDGSIEPKLHVMDYAKPGDEIDRPVPVLLTVDGKRAQPLDTGLCPNPWSIDSIHWRRDSSRFYFEYNERGHQVLRVLVVDAETGEVGRLIEETSPTFIDYAQKHFLQYLDDSDEVLWMSERDGWNHLDCFDMRTGQLLRQVTQGAWVVKEVRAVDPDNRTVTLVVGGIFPEQDPYHEHWVRVGLDDGKLITLTSANGDHEVTLSPDGRFLVARWSRVDHPPVTELRRADTGELVMELERADWSALLATGWKVPERFVAAGRDGVTPIYGVVYRPSNYDPNRKWPVIETIYAGPQGAFVPKRFATEHYGQSLTELGFVVVQIDGMGTNWRSKAFHDVCSRNLGDSGFPDRILWLKALAAKDSSLDLERVGIFGGSAGGQSAMRALLAHGDFYKVAVADCGCHDNRVDKIWWNELWMGWPIGDHYADQSNVTQAHRLTGKLMLVVGEMDRNVDPACTLQVVDALVKADKDFEFLMIPGGGHGAAESPYGQRRRRDFFVRHLLGVEPAR